MKGQVDATVALFDISLLLGEQLISVCGQVVVFHLNSMPDMRERRSLILTRRVTPSFGCSPYATDCTQATSSNHMPTRQGTHIFFK